MAVYRKQDNKRDPFELLLAALGVGTDIYRAMSVNKQAGMDRESEAAKAAADRALTEKGWDAQAEMQRGADASADWRMLKKEGYEFDPKAGRQYRPAVRDAAPAFTGEATDAQLATQTRPRISEYVPDYSRLTPRAQDMQGAWRKPEEPDAVAEMLRMNEALAGATPEGAQYGGFTSGGPRYDYPNDQPNADLQREALEWGIRDRMQGDRPGAWVPDDPAMSRVNPDMSPAPVYRGMEFIERPEESGTGGMSEKDVLAAAARFYDPLTPKEFNRLRAVDDSPYASMTLEQYNAQALSDAISTARNGGISRDAGQGFDSVLSQYVPPNEQLSGSDLMELKAIYDAQGEDQLINALLSEYGTGL